MFLFSKIYFLAIFENPEKFRSDNVHIPLNTQLTRYVFTFEDDWNKIFYMFSPNAILLIINHTVRTTK